MGLSLERIVQSAIELADTEGLGAISMKRVAERLGFTTMSLYRYVTSKDDLLLLMHDTCWMPRPGVDIPSGDLNMMRYVELLIHTGYPQRYCQVMGTKTAPLIVEAESAYRDLDATSANGIQYVRDHLCFPLAAGSFEDGMGA